MGCRVFDNRPAVEVGVIYVFLESVQTPVSDAASANRERTDIRPSDAP